MTTIQTATEQGGGWFNISIGLTSELTKCPAYLTNSNIRKLVITPVNDSVEILPIGENMIITEPSSLTSSGKLYDIKGEFEISGQSKAIDDLLDYYFGKDIFMVGIKHHGQQKIYGSVKFPLDFNYTFLNGKLYEDGSRIRITITGKIPQKPVFIND